MAENKKSVLLYCDIIHSVESLKDAEAGRLFKHFLRYINDQNPEPPDRITQITFEPIKQSLKRDLRKWEKRSERNSKTAKDAWSKRTHTNASERIKKDANEADSVSDSVSDSEEEKGKSSGQMIYELRNIQDLSKELLNEDAWVNVTCKSLCIEKESILGKMIDFLSHLSTTTDTAKTKIDFASHFIHYTRKQLNLSKNGNTKGNYRNATSSSAIIPERSANEFGY